MNEGGSGNDGCEGRVVVVVMGVVVGDEGVVDDVRTFINGIYM